MKTVACKSYAFSETTGAATSYPFLYAVANTFSDIDELAHYCSFFIQFSITGINIFNGRNSFHIF